MGGELRVDLSARHPLCKVLTGGNTDSCVLQLACRHCKITCYAHGSRRSSFMAGNIVTHQTLPRVHWSR